MLVVFPFVIILVLVVMCVGIVVITRGRRNDRLDEASGVVVPARLVSFHHMPGRGRGATLSQGICQPVVEYTLHGVTRTVAAANSLDTAAARAHRATAPLEVRVDPGTPTRCRIVGFRATSPLRIEGWEFLCLMMVLLSSMVPVVINVFYQNQALLVVFPLVAAVVLLGVGLTLLLRIRRKRTALAGDTRTTQARLVNIVAGYSRTWLTLAITGPDAQSIEHEAVFPAAGAGGLANHRIGDVVPAVYPTDRPEWVWPAAAPPPNATAQQWGVGVFALLFALAWIVIFSVGLW